MARTYKIAVLPGDGTGPDPDSITLRWDEQVQGAQGVAGTTAVTRTLTIPVRL